MKKLIHSLSAIGFLGAAAVALNAQPAPKIAVVDINKIYINHYDTQAQEAKLEVDKKGAQAEVDQANKEGQALVSQYKELVDAAKNPAATAEAKQKAQEDAQAKLQEIQNKQNEIQTLMTTAQQTFQQRINTFHTVMMDQISKVALDVAKRHNATIVLDKSGMTTAGVPAVLFADPAYDITDEVMAEINKTRPPTPPPRGRAGTGIGAGFRYRRAEDQPSDAGKP